MRKYYLLPQKHFPAEKTILGLAINILKMMPLRFIIDEFYEKTVVREIKGIDFNTYIVVLDFLYVIGKIELREREVYKI